MGEFCVLLKGRGAHRVVLKMLCVFLCGKSGPCYNLSLSFTISNL